MTPEQQRSEPAPINDVDVDFDFDFDEVEDAVVDAGGHRVGSGEIEGPNPV